VTWGAIYDNLAAHCPLIRGMHCGTTAAHFTFEQDGVSLSVCLLRQECLTEECVRRELKRVRAAFVCRFGSCTW
jgi:hypothetical protein